MKTKYALALMLVGMLAAAQAIAEKPANTGSDHKNAQRGPPEQARSGQMDTHGRQDGGQGAQGQGAQGQGAQGQGAQGQGAAANVTGHFGDQQRAAIRNYYGEEFRRGHCPPGLAKKHNGCMPPGQVKNWAVGQQLPRDVIFHNLPAQLATQLGQPPAGHRYVRAADDILLITSGTGLVIDAIPGLGLQ
jgi:Ni/Co efflux regulator RcnB